MERFTREPQLIASPVSDSPVMCNVNVVTKGISKEPLQMCDKVLLPAQYNIYSMQEYID